MSGGYRTTAAPQPKSRCFDCHDEHAGLDKVFTQFYGLLNDAREDQTSTVAGPR
jgi:hypothetical protein